MLSGRDVHRTQDIVCTGNVGRLSVNGGYPAVRIIDFGEYDNAVFRIIRFINQTVWFVTCQTHAGKTVFMGSGNTFQNIFETSIYYGSFCWQYGVQGINFLVGIVHVLHIVDEPCIAVSVRILDRNCLPLSGREDKIFRVQHIQNAELGSIHTVHLTTCGSNIPIGCLHFG